MKKFLYPIACLFTLLTTTTLLAQNFTIEGQINFAFLSLPVPGHNLDIYSVNGLHQQTLTTDHRGIFSATFDIGVDTGQVFIVQTVDPCYGELRRHEVRSVTDTVFVQFLVCQPDGLPCRSHFEYFPIGELEVQFIDLSSGSIEQRKWFFGDGASSTETSPAHDYDEAGTYLVTQIVEGRDSCLDTLQREVYVGIEPCFCPEYYAPVCVQGSFGQIDTFSNPCFARCAGYEQFVSCHDSCDCPDLDEPVCIWTIEGEITYKNLCEALCDGMDTSFICDTSCYCPEIYDPVCVITSDGDTLTFTNECFAHCAGYPDFFDCSLDCECERIYQPVCITLPSGEVITFNNACLAECAGYSDYQLCDSSCICDTIYDPVCVVTDDGEVLEFTNSCHADCHGYPYAAPCDSCICPLYFAPVCVIAGNGDTLQFDNPCLAECAGYYDHFICSPGCECEGIIDPVCVKLDDGTMERFQSACAAICAGHHVFYDCATVCDCPDTADPVCVTSPDGTKFEFLNACYAQCAGQFDFEHCTNSVPDIPDDGESASDIQLVEMVAYPNPFQNHFQLSGRPGDGADIHLEIIDVLGKSVYSKIIRNREARWALQVNGGHWPAGTYLVKVREGAHAEVIKLIKG